MSKWGDHKSGGNSAFSVFAQASAVAKTNYQTSTWMHKQGKMCWTCQKQSVPEKGCVMNINMGLHKYVCKPCVDARKAKEAT